MNGKTSGYNGGTTLLMKKHLVMMKNSIRNNQYCFTNQSNYV